LTYPSLEHVVRTGHPNRHEGAYTDCFHPRTGKEIGWWLELFIKEQDQELRINASRWSVDWWSRMKINVRMFALKKSQESASYFVLFRTLCTISAKYANINHLHKEKVFQGKSLIHCLKIRDWDQCTSSSYTRTPNLPGYWIS